MNSAQLKSAFWPKQEALLETLLQDELRGGSPDLIQAMQHQVFVGGKRIRALIPVLISQQLARGEHTQNAALYLGLSAELLHSATLCHDDIMDEDRMRRHAPTVWVKHGIPQAINAGDILFYMAEKIIHRAPLSAESKLLALEYVAQCMCKVVHGQALEIELKRNHALPTAQSYTEVVAGKTGGLFSLALVYGGIASELPTPQIQTLSELGLQLGEHFQIRDDILDLLGDKGRNLHASDLWESKPSWLIAQAASRLPEAQRTELARLLYIPRAEKKESDIQDLLMLLESSGTLKMARDYNLGSQLNIPELDQWQPLIASLVELIQAPAVRPPQQNASLEL